MKRSAIHPHIGLLVAVASLVPAACGGRALRSQNRVGAGRDRTISRIVQLLQQLLQSSEAEAEQDRKLYAEYKCYCDNTTSAKAESIKALTTQIALLQSDLQQLQGSNSGLSLEAQQLQATMDANSQARQEADSLRANGRATFAAQERDLSDAIARLNQAIEALATIGADQTLEAAADHRAFMANYTPSLLKLQSTVSQALVDARSLLRSEQRDKAVALLQQPFFGSYTPQSGEVIGILKRMKETFESNLAVARAAENQTEAAHTAFMGTKQEEWQTMKVSYDTKQGSLGAHDGSLADKKTSLAQAEQHRTDDGTTLAEVTKACEQKAKEYQQRKEFHASEQAALYEAITILDNDVASKTFGAVNATSTGALSFVQLHRVRRRFRGQGRGSSSSSSSSSASSSDSSSSAQATRRQIVQILTMTAKAHGSTKLANVALRLGMGNPFADVLAAIEKVRGIIAEEARVDKEQLDWCTPEVDTNQQSFDATETEIIALQNDIGTLEQNINDPGRGLKVMIGQEEAALAQNQQAQADETLMRRQETGLYEEQAATSRKARALLTKAIKALRKHFAAVAPGHNSSAGALIQDPLPPPTWDGNFTGQRDPALSVISQLEFVLTETEKEEALLHETEQRAQAAYEDSMATVRRSEEDLRADIVQFKADLAEARQNLNAKQEDLDKTEVERRSISRYLASIRPDCDFISKNFDDRESRRSSETAALDQAVTLIKATPAFTAAENAALVAAQGRCAAKCQEDANHVSCKACLASVSEPGYCAGHAGTPGC